MSLIQHVYRRGAVYWWRRRLPFSDCKNGSSRIEVSLGTRTAEAARRVAAAVTFESERLKDKSAKGMLTPEQTRQLLTQVARRHAAKLDTAAATDLVNRRGIRALTHFR